MSDTLIWIRRAKGPCQPATMDEIRDRLGIDAGAVYRVWNVGFGATLSAAQVEAARQDPDIRVVDADEPGRPAPYRPTTSPNRIPDAYIVKMREGADAAGTASALGLRPTALYRTIFTGFAATMTAEQLRAVRHHPDVTWVVNSLMSG
ncbi:protease inhibitor I9 family protein [Actinoplanes missouriensis]|uniref:protease inhibitor I9 family protein n=1 Tax=Actinoplanes missouriensis TaxID=1866 RepID=UPI0033FB09CC